MLARRWRGVEVEDGDDEVPYGPRAEGSPSRLHRGFAVSSADAVAAVLWVGVTFYAVFGGADFGAGFWALVAGGGEAGERPRELIDAPSARSGRPTTFG